MRSISLPVIESFNEAMSAGDAGEVRVLQSGSSNLCLFNEDDLMIDETKLALEYITDESGQRRSVILPIATFEALLEDLQDLAAIVERRNEPTISHEELIAELKRDGLLPD